MAVASTIEVLEKWFQINSSVLDSSSVFIKYTLYLFLLLRSNLKIFSSCHVGVLRCNGLDSGCGIFINTFLSEGKVDCLAEIAIVKHIVICLIFLR